jgi:SAM-dependent methyltransferase
MAVDRTQISAVPPVTAEDGACKICGAALVHATVVPGYQEPQHYSILDCTTCHTMVAVPTRSEPGVYDAIYGVPGGPPGYDRNFQYARRVTHRKDPLGYLASRQDAFWGVRRALENVGARRVLEVGCGLGYLTYALRRAGYDAVGIDFSSEAIAKATRSYGDFYQCRSVESYATASQERFDAIVMVEVIEHLEKPVDLIAKALQLLNTQGVVIVTTPNRSFVNDGECWVTDLPPVHLWWFSEDSLQTMGRRLNCSVCFVDFRDYNSRHPVLFLYKPPRQPMLDAGGALIRRESFPISLARRLGILQDAYWLTSLMVAPLWRSGTSRRPTLVAVIEPTR